MYGGDCDAAIAKAATAVTHVQSQSQQVGSSDEGLGVLFFYLSSVETNFWWLEDNKQYRLRLFSCFVRHFTFVEGAVKPVCTHDGGCP